MNLLFAYTLRPQETLDECGELLKLGVWEYTNTYLHTPETPASLLSS